MLGLGEVRVLPDEGGLRLRVTIAVVLELLPKRELEALVLLGDIGMGIEIIAKVNLVIVAGNAQVDVENPLGEAFRRVTLVEVAVGHGQVAMGCKPRLGRIDGRIIGQLDEYVDDGFCPDAVAAPAEEREQDKRNRLTVNPSSIYKCLRR